MNSVRLYYIKHQGENDLAQMGVNTVENWLQQLSEQKRSSVLRLVHMKNRLTSLIGLQLLDSCAQVDGVEGFNLCDVQYPEAGKPFWKHDNIFYDFNISHSGNFILVAASRSLKVGVDVEEIRELNRLNFKMVLSEDELEKIQQTPASFFELWSKKEAVVKAANTAGLARMRDVKLNQQIATLDDTQWHLKNISLDDSYAINLATSAPVDDLIVQQIPLTSLK